MAATTVPVVKWDNVNVDNLVFGEVTINKQGGRSIPVTYRQDGKTTPLLVQFPKARLPFGGMSTYVDKNDGRASSSISIGFDSSDVEGMSPTMQKLFALFKTFDERCIGAAQENAGTWFVLQRNGETGKYDPLTPEQVKGMWTDSIKWPKPDAKTGVVPDYAPTVKAKVPVYKGGTVGTQYYGQEKQDGKPCPIASEDVTMGADAVCLWELYGIWVVQGSCGASWTCKQVKNYGNNQLTSCAIQTESDDEAEADEDDDDATDGPTLKRQKQ